MAEKKAFVFDTNFIIQNQNLNDALDKLKEKFSIYITQVSIDERIAQNCRDLKGQFDDAEKCKLKFIHFATISFKKTYEEESGFYQKGIQTKYENYFGDHIIPFTKDGEMLATIIDRANRRLPPFWQPRMPVIKALRIAYCGYLCLTTLKTTAKMRSYSLQTTKALSETTQSVCKKNFTR